MWDSLRSRESKGSVPMTARSSGEKLQGHFLFGNSQPMTSCPFTWAAQSVKEEYEGRERTVAMPKGPGGHFVSRCLIDLYEFCNHELAPEAWLKCLMHFQWLIQRATFSLHHLWLIPPHIHICICEYETTIYWKFYTYSVIRCTVWPPQMGFVIILLWHMEFRMNHGYTVSL